MFIQCMELFFCLIVVTFHLTIKIRVLEHKFLAPNRSLHANEFSFHVFFFLNSTHLRFTEHLETVLTDEFQQLAVGEAEELIFFSYLG